MIRAYRDWETDIGLVNICGKYVMAKNSRSVEAFSLSPLFSVNFEVPNISSIASIYPSPPLPV